MAEKINKQVKTIKLSVPTWKILMQIKLDSGVDSLDRVVLDMIELKGGY